MGSTFTWTNSSIACVATYKTLERNDRMDEFEGIDVPFDKAGTVKMSQLNYYTNASNDPNILKTFSLNLARKFLKYLVQDYSVTRQTNQISDQNIITGIAAVLADGTKTLTDLANTTSQLVKFS